MESATRIHCWILAVIEPSSETLPQRTQRTARLQWAADPFICQLISKLQQEVREERRADARGPLTAAARFTPADPSRLRCTLQPARAEAEITWRETPLYFCEPDFDAWERTSVPPEKRCNLPR